MDQGNRRIRLSLSEELFDPNCLSRRTVHLLEKF
jgi:hypothetical protein